MRILIAIPSYDGWTVTSQAAFHLEAGRLVDHEIILLDPITSLPIDVARNQAVAAARQERADVLFTLDADAIPAPGTLRAFVEFLETQRKAGTPAVIAAPHSMAGGGVVPIGCTSAREIQQTDQIVSTHTVAYDMRAFDRIASPYYQFEYNADRTYLLVGEDAHCHQKMLNAGIPMFYHAGLWSGHAKMRTLERPRVVPGW